MRKELYTLYILVSLFASCVYQPNNGGSVGNK